MKLSYAQKLVGCVFIIPSVILLCLSAILDSFKCFEFGMMLLFAGSPFWGFILFSGWLMSSQESETSVNRD